MFETESEWQERLGNILRADYQHDVYPEVVFKNDADTGRIDLYVMTHPDWIHHDIFPNIGIECKLLEKEGMNWVTASIQQMRRYSNPNNTFWYNGSKLPALDICLLATPESWHEGIVYQWKGQLRSGPAGEQAWDAITYFFERVLMLYGCSILLDKRFHSNIGGGPIRSYYLGE